MSLHTIRPAGTGGESCGFATGRPAACRAAFCLAGPPGPLAPASRPTGAICPAIWGKRPPEGAFWRKK